MHASAVMLCIKKRNARTDALTDGRTHKRPRSNMPLQLLRSWGHKKDCRRLYDLMSQSTKIKLTNKWMQELGFINEEEYKKTLIK